MKESKMITLLVIGLVMFGAAAFYFNNFYSSFTFSSATLIFDGNNVTERLTYIPDKPYHTLFRNFITPIFDSYAEYMSPSADHITMSDVECSSGTSYYKYYDSTFYSSSGIPYLAYTERNEYGCGFGEVTGFEKGKEYIITSRYTLHPHTLYEFNGRHYIRFVAYSEDIHPFLKRGKNLILSDGALSADFYIPKTNTMIYIPYEPENIQGYDIIRTDNLDFGGSIGDLMLKILIYILPAIICLLVWLLFGKENAEGDYPEELSQYPKERKAWEVSAYFHPPFGDLDQNFMPTMIMDFYNRKIIDIKIREEGLFKSEEVFIKILPIPPREKLDDMELKIVNFLKEIEVMEEPKDGYFSIKHASTRFLKGSMVTKKFNELKKEIKKKSKEHLDYKGKTILNVLLFICFFMQIMVFGVNTIFTYFAYAPLIIVGIVANNSSLFVKFKDDAYLEYQQWQGFQKYLSTLDSMKRSPPQGVILWEKYLVYATALGVGKQVLETLRKMNIIDSKTYNSYSMIYMPGSFGTTTSSGGGSGGGMGGGGMGGGGGGGR